MSTTINFDGHSPMSVFAFRGYLYFKGDEMAENVACREKCVAVLYLSYILNSNSIYVDIVFHSFLFDKLSTRCVLVLI